MQLNAQVALRRVWLQKERARYQKRLHAHPEDIPSWRGLARVSWEAGDVTQALAAFERILAAQPHDTDALLGCIGSALRLGRPAQALAIATELLGLFPAHVDALLYQLEALQRLGESAQALKTADQVIKLAGVDAERRAMALSGKATALEQLERFPEALAVLEVLTEVSAPIEALCAKARVLAILERFEEADALLEALQAQLPHRLLEQIFEPWRLPDETLPDGLPKRYTGRGLYLMRFFIEQAQCDWRHREAVLAHFADLSSDALKYGFVAGIEPFSLLNLPIDPAIQTAVAQAQAKAVVARMAPLRESLNIQWPCDLQAGRLRIGYVSGDFRHHATAHLTRKLFQVHDRTQFEIVGFSLRPSDNSHYWQEISQSCDKFIELAGLTHAEAATRIAQEGIHILVDLHGYTRFARPELFALQPAPVQVAFLGYPGTLGAEYVPHIVADRVVLPENIRAHFSEQPLYMDCYQVNDDAQPIATTGITRASAGLPEKGFVYCCFNRPEKIEPTVFAVWMQILQETPDSVLWLLESTPRCAENLQIAAQKGGVAPERLIFAPRLPKDQHLERHRLADLFLDTFVYNAHTTASDALWAGLPILTLCGTAFPSRVCTSLLSALGLADWLVTTSALAYEQQAVALSRDPERLQQLRSVISQRRISGPPFETAHFARQLEQAFITLWAGHRQ